MKEALSSSETSIHTKPHGVTSQKTSFFIVTAVKTSNLTRLCSRASSLCSVSHYIYGAANPEKWPTVIATIFRHFLTRF
jgi:hypothetical protein